MFQIKKPIYRLLSSLSTINLKILNATVACACLDTRGLASLARDKHTPRKLNSTEIRKSGVLTEAESPAEPLGRSSAFTVTHFPFFDRILPFEVQLHLRICSMTALLTLPM